jgi:dCMP deaminase
MERQTWNEYFCEIAKTVSSRSTCPRLAVGCVLVRDRMILATGYNGSLSNAPHCCDVGCVMENNHCIAAVHAEINAVTQAAKNGTSLAHAVAYITINPCLNCYKVLYQAGIRRIVYIEKHPSGCPNYEVLKLSNNAAPDLVCLKDSFIATKEPDRNY